MDWSLFAATLLTVVGTNALTWAGARTYEWARARRYYADELNRLERAHMDAVRRIDRLRAQRDEARARVYEHIDGLSAEFVGSEGEG